MTRDPAAASPALTYAPARPRPDLPFILSFGIIGGAYLLLIICMLLADASFTTPGHLLGALKSRYIRYATTLSLVSCSVTTILSLWVAIPLGYLLSRWDDSSIRRGLDRVAATIAPGMPWLRPLLRALNPKVLIDTILDIPIVLPPLVIGLSLL